MESKAFWIGTRVLDKLTLPFSISGIRTRTWILGPMVYGAFGVAF